MIGKLTDIFKVQDEISTTVAKALNIALSTAPTGVVSCVAWNEQIVERITCCCRGIISFPVETAAITQKLSIS